MRIVSVAVLGMVLLSGRAGAELRAGAASATITPDPRALPYTLGGYADLSRLRNSATGVLDTCYARALVMTDGKAKVAIVSLDLCYMPANVKTAVQSRIAATGIAPEALFLSATHTHSGPEPLRLLAANSPQAGELPAFDPNLLAWIADHIAQAIVAADQNLRPARVGAGQMGGIGLNRNRRGEKVTDDELTVLKVTDAEGKPLAAIFNYAAHPTYFGAGNLQVSGDWSGAFERTMEAELPGAVALFINGAEGDASPNGADSGTPEEKIQTYAAKLAQPARALYERIVPATDVPLTAWTQAVELGARQPNPLFLLAAAGMRATAEQARDLVNRIMPDRCELTFVRAGDFLFVGFPGEPTAPVGLAAKQMAREKGVKMPAVAALTNGWLGYLVTAEQYRAGKYEPTMSFYGPTIGEKVLAGLKEGLARLP